MARDPMRIPTEMAALVPPDGTSKIQGRHGIPPPVSVQYVQYMEHGVQQFGSSSNPPQQPMRKFIKQYAKALGAIQIIIGLIEILLWVVQVAVTFKDYQFGHTISHLSFMGGMFYIASGSVSISAEKHLNSNLVNCSVGMNITSAVVASFGILAYIFMVVSYAMLPPFAYVSANLFLAFSILFLFLTIFEFCIAIMVSHFECRANCFTNNIAIAYVPCTITGENVAPTEDNWSHPTYVKIVPYMGV